MLTQRTDSHLIFGLAVLKTVGHLVFAATLAPGFHRDELLYLALGRHLDWGFWSNPPLIGAVSWLVQHTLGDSLFAARFFPSIVGGLLVWMTGQMALGLGGGRFAALLSAAVVFVSPAGLALASLFQPVPFDVLCWATATWLTINYLRTQKPHWLWALGLTVGAGLMNKYTVVFLVLGLAVGLLLTVHRRVFMRREMWQAAVMAVLVALPNLVWQWRHGFPVVTHMRELSENQLANVEISSFLGDQFLLYGLGFLLWLPGVIWLFWSRDWRVMGWFFVSVLFVLAVLHGKAYYTLGIYPVAIAAGGVFWEGVCRRIWQKTALAVGLVGLSLPLVPAAIPVFPIEKLERYFQWLAYEKGVASTVRWETGQLEKLPQDYADMLGWPELGALVDAALAGEILQNCLVYCENYGQAGAAQRFSRQARAAQVVSFSDSYRLWAPDRLAPQVQTLVYVNDELGDDVAALFADIRKVGSVGNPLARERDATVWVCRAPRGSFPDFWAKRVAEVKTEIGLK